MPISGTVNGVGGTLSGTFAISKFTQKSGQLFATGTLTATVLDAAGNITQTIIRQITLPVTNVTGTCEVLHLNRFRDATASEITCGASLCRFPTMAATNVLSRYVVCNQRFLLETTAIAPRY